MCLACEEEAFYRAYLDHLANRAGQVAAPAAPAASDRGRPDDETPLPALNDKP